MEYTIKPRLYINDQKNWIFSDGIENGKLGGTSTFFPSTWSNAKIKAEVEFAIENNHGLVPGQPLGQNLMFGYSKDGAIEIRFAFNADGSGTYYSIKK